MEYVCPRCNYNTNRKANVIRHVENRKICTLRNLDVIPRDYKDIILRNIDTNEVIKCFNITQVEKMCDCSDEITKLRDEIKGLKDKLLKVTNGGYIYVLHNPIFESYGENVYKIGCSLNPDKRKADFSTMYISESDIVYVSNKFPNKLEAERTLFKIIDKHRCTRKREFFDLELRDIIKFIKSVEDTLI